MLTFEKVKTYTGTGTVPYNGGTSMLFIRNKNKNHLRVHICRLQCVVGGFFIISFNRFVTDLQPYIVNIISVRSFPDFFV